MKRKKPTKRTRSNKKRTKPVLNVLSPLHPLYRQAGEETKITIGDLYRAVKWAMAAEKYSEALEEQLELRNSIVATTDQLLRLVKDNRVKVKKRRGRPKSKTEKLTRLKKIAQTKKMDFDNGIKKLLFDVAGDYTAETGRKITGPTIRRGYPEVLDILRSKRIGKNSI